MKRFFAHFMRIIRKFWFILLIIAPISPVFFLGVLIMMTTISMIFFNDPVDIEAEVEDLMSNFTEEELEIIFADKVDEKVSDEEYLGLIAKYQSYVCGKKKIDKITTWVGSEVHNDSYIYLYELDDKKNIVFDIDKQKEGIRNSLNKENVQTYRIINSGRSLVFRYTFRSSGETKDVVFSNEELKNL